MAKFYIMAKSLNVPKSININLVISEGQGTGHTIADIAAKYNVPVQKVVDQVSIGMQFEKEHSNKPEVQQQIVMNHFWELGLKYYDHKEGLPAMEARLKNEAETGLNKQHIKTIDTLQSEVVNVFTVNRNYVNLYHYPDFTMGGHHYVSKEYEFIPEGEIWIDQDLDETGRAATIKHEQIEYELMKFDNMSYDEAHKIALKGEIPILKDSMNNLKMILVKSAPINLIEGKFIREFYKNEENVLQLLYSKNSKDSFQIEYIFVLQPTRRKGVGSKLMDFAKKRALELGFSEILYTVADYEGNEYDNLVKFVKKNGFEFIEKSTKKMKFNLKAKVYNSPIIDELFKNIDPKQQKKVEKEMMLQLPENKIKVRIKALEALLALTKNATKKQDIKKRINALKILAKMIVKKSDPDLPFKQGGNLKQFGEGGNLGVQANITRNEAKQGIEIRFPERAPEVVINYISNLGFRYSKFQRMYYVKFSEQVWEKVNDYFSTNGESNATPEPPKTGPDLEYKIGTIYKYSSQADYAISNAINVELHHGHMDNTDYWNWEKDPATKDDLKRERKSKMLRYNGNAKFTLKESDNNYSPYYTFEVPGVIDWTDKTVNKIMPSNFNVPVGRTKIDKEIEGNKLEGFSAKEEFKVGEKIIFENNNFTWRGVIEKDTTTTYTMRSAMHRIDAGGISKPESEKVEHNKMYSYDIMLNIGLTKHVYPREIKPDTGEPTDEMPLIKMGLVLAYPFDIWKNLIDNVATYHRRKKDEANARLSIKKQAHAKAAENYKTKVHDLKKIYYAWEIVNPEFSRMITKETEAEQNQRLATWQVDLGIETTTAPKSTQEIKPEPEEIQTITQPKFKEVGHEGELEALSSDMGIPISELIQLEPPVIVPDPEKTKRETFVAQITMLLRDDGFYLHSGNLILIAYNENPTHNENYKQAVNQDLIINTLKKYDQFEKYGTQVADAYVNAEYEKYNFESIKEAITEHSDIYIFNQNHLVSALINGEHIGIDINKYRTYEQTIETEPNNQSFFKGTDYTYENRYQINKAIEEFIDTHTQNFTVPVNEIEMSSEELIFISKYSGYGGLEKFGATGIGLLYEYFTPEDVIKKMWGLAVKYGYKNGPVCEPSVGVGRFLKFAPDQQAVTGYEINKYSTIISQLLYPKANIILQPFEKTFIKNNLSIKAKTDNLQKFELLIGNPPYGALQGKYFGMGEKDYTQAGNFIEYFILRGLDLLVKDGLLVYIVGAELMAGGSMFLSKERTPAKVAIAQKAVLVDAYRLPSGLFDNTGVTTEIIVLRKK